MTMKQATSSCPHSYPCRLSNTYGRSQRRIHERTVLLDSTWPKKVYAESRNLGTDCEPGRMMEPSPWVDIRQWHGHKLAWLLDQWARWWWFLKNSHFLKPTSTALGKMKRVVYPWVTYRVLWIWLAASYNPSPCKHTQLNSPRYP